MTHVVLQTDKDLDELNRALEQIGIGRFGGEYAADKPMAYAVNLVSPFKTDVHDYDVQELIDALEAKGFDTTSLGDQLYEREEEGR